MNADKNLEMCLFCFLTAVPCRVRRARLGSQARTARPTDQCLWVLI